MVDVQTMFLKMNRNLVFDENFLFKNQVDGFLRVPMSVESFELPQPLISSFKAMVNTFAGVGDDANKTTNDAFLAELRKSNDVLMQFPVKEAQAEQIMAQLISCKDAP